MIPIKQPLPEEQQERRELVKQRTCRYGIFRTEFCRVAALAEIQNTSFTCSISRRYLNQAGISLADRVQGSV
jgi:hypothetical protein